MTRGDERQEWRAEESKSPAHICPSFFPDWISPSAWTHSSGDLIPVSLPPDHAPLRFCQVSDNLEETQVWSLEGEDTLEEEIATDSSTIFLIN